MNQGQGERRFANLQSNSSQDNYRTPFQTFAGHSTGYSSGENAPFSYANAETDWEHADGFGGSFAGLQLDGNDSYSNSEISDGTYGRRYNINWDTDQAQDGAVVIDPVLTPESLCRAHTVLTPSQPTNSTESPLTYANSGPWSERNTLNLQPPTYTPQRSSAATHSLYSGSTCETDPSPSADEDELLPMPDDNTACMQSYNDPRTGIWAQDNTSGQATTYSTIRNTGHDNTTSSMMTQSLPPHLQQIIADADAATPFGTQSYPSGGVLSAHANLGADWTPAPSLTAPSMSRGPILGYFQPTMNGLSGVSIALNNTMGFGVSLSQQPLNVERPLYPLGGSQGSSPNIAPRIVPNNPYLAAANPPSIRSTSSPTPATSPSHSTDTSNSVVVLCKVEGCRANFTGSAWRDSLRRHMKNQHGDEEMPVCPVCHEVFRSRRPDNLKRHMKSQHPGQTLRTSRKTRTRRSALKRRHS